MVSKSFLDQAAELVDQGTGGDRDEVTSERQEPAGEGVAATDPEVPIVGVAGDRLAQAEGRGGSAGGGGELDHGGDGVAGTQLPALAGGRGGLYVETPGGLVLVVERALFAHAPPFPPGSPGVFYR